MKRGRVFLAVLALGVCLFSQTPLPTPNIIVPGFSIRPYAPFVGDTVKFTDFSQGNITSWLWEFGDGATSSERNPTHVYTTPGNYPMTLTISDGTVSVSMTINAWGE